MDDSVYRGYKLIPVSGWIDIFHGGEYVDRTYSVDAAKKIIDEWLEAK